MDSNELKEQFRIRVAISNIKKERDIAMENRNLYFGKKSIAVACACLILTTGVTFAKDIEAFIKDKFGLGKGVQTAVENGYIAHSDNDFVKSEVLITDGVDNVLGNANIGIKIDDFFMDDYNFSVEFKFQFDEKSKESMRIDDINNCNVNLNDLIIIDNEDKIVFNSANEEKFNSFCNERKLNYKYLEFNENYMNNGLNSFTNDENLLVYNMYAEEKYPKSKELDFYFSKITIENTINNSKFILDGDWKLHLDIPEKMYNRKPIEYKVLSCENDKFNVYASEVTDTGFEIGITISDIEKPSYPEELEKKKREIMGTENEIPKGEPKFIGYSETGAECYQVPVSFVSSDDNFQSNKNNNENEKIKELYMQSPYKEMYEEYSKKIQPINIFGNSPIITSDTKTDGCYIINSEGVKFEPSMNPTRKENANFIDENKFDFYETFDLNKIDATDRITVIIEFYGEPVKIELEVDN